MFILSVTFLFNHLKQNVCCENWKMLLKRMFTELIKFCGEGELFVIEIKFYASILCHGRMAVVDAKKKPSAFLLKCTTYVFLRDPPSSSKKRKSMLRRTACVNRELCW